MTIADVLRKKGDGVATIVASAPVSDAVAILARENFGAIVVLGADGGVVGILSERDIVRCLNEQQASVLTRPVAAVMTADPLSCSRDGSIFEVLQMMVGWNIRHLPVMENNVLLGLVSMGDLVRFTMDLGVYDTSLAPPLHLPELDS